MRQRLARFAAATALLPLLAAQTPRQSYQSALDAFQQGNPFGAVRTLEASLAGHPDQPEAWKLLGIVYASQQDYAAAEPAFGQACRRDSRLTDACFYHGRVLYLLNRFEEALTTLRPLAAKDRRVPRLLALSLDGLGRWTEAEAQYRRALQVTAGTGPEDARVDYGIALIRQGQAARALPYLTAAAGGNSPDKARAAFQLGRATLQLDRVEEARTHLETSVALDAGNGAVHLLLGRVYQRLGLADKAAHHLALGQKLSR